jgi:hypothetical protein
MPPTHLFVKQPATFSLRRSWTRVAAILPLVFPLLVVAIGLGLWLALARTNAASPQERIATWLVIMVPLALWLLIVSLLARKGTYLRVPLALPVGVLVPPAIGLLLGISLPHMPELLHTTPQAWLIGFMVIRLVGGVFLVAWASGEVERPLFNVWAGSLDVFVGATALPVAWLVASGSSIAMVIAVGWNLVGLVDFVMAIAISNVVANAGPRYMLSLKGPVMNALRPTILGIVTFGVPLAIGIHLLSLWQLLAT